MVAIFVFSFVLCALLSLVLLLRARAHARRYSKDMPQRFHKGDIPRVGGVAISLATLAAWCLAASAPHLGLTLNTSATWKEIALWSCALAPVTLAGAYEDVTQLLGVRWRLAASLLSGVLACALLGLAVPRLGVLGLDAVWTMVPWLGIGFAVLAIAGLPHAFNIIDGYNGLAGIVSILVCGSIAYVALQLGDRALAGLMVGLMGSTAGFLFWNYPRGLIFAGDGGAYLWGGAIAIACVSLVQRHPSVSPWFVMLLLIYPVSETIFSIYRKLMRGVSPGVADSLHFHQLVYKRIVRGVFHDNETRRMLMRNNRTSPYLWGFTVLTVAPAVLFWRNTPVLVGFCGLFVVTYVVAYLAIIRFKVPSWVRR